MDWNTMSPARQKAATYAASVEAYLEAYRQTEITMTEATTAIWGTSGTGNPNAVRIIEACTAYGFLTIRKHGKRARYISAKPGAVPIEALSAKDRQERVDTLRGYVTQAVDYEVELMKRNIDAATTPEAKTQAFLGGVAAMLTTGARRR